MRIGLRRSSCTLASCWLLACGGTGSGGAAASGGGASGAGGLGGATGGSSGTGASGAPTYGGSAGVAGASGAGSAPSGPPGVPATIERVAGNGAALLEGWPGGTLRVRVEDAAGAPVSNVTVTWSVVSGEGANLTSPGQPTDLTDSNGIAARMLQGVAFSASQPFGQALIRASTSVGSVDFVTTTVHLTSAGPIGPLIVMTEPESHDLGDVKAGSVVKGAAKLQAVVQAGVFSGTPLPNVALRFVDPANHELDAVANCVGGGALTDASGIAVCDLEVGTALGKHSLAPFGGETTLFSAMALNVVP